MNENSNALMQEVADALEWRVDYSSVHRVWIGDTLMVVVAVNDEKFLLEARKV